ncbi:hypothetical protein BN1723_013010 [Verticillium longisporum]|uniref:Uncharacterized protein n=1 Tax=Verticillium longisporum TaxID=100787 RepID=A0A0G4LNM1_VERLO|nr:hypothetical protein BN1723_013010 [Verticillium longisporum]
MCSSVADGPDVSMAYSVGLRQLCRDWFSGSCASYLPFVDACHMSKTALGMPAPVSTSRMTPWKCVSWPSDGMSCTTLAPRSRNGVSGDQKGPRMADDVGALPSGISTVWLISSTSLVLLVWGLEAKSSRSRREVTEAKKIRTEKKIRTGKKNARLDAQNVAHAPRLVAVLLVRLAQRVDVVDARDPLVLRQLDLAAKVVHVADQRREDDALAGVRLGAHEINDMLCEVGVELGRALGLAVGVAVGGAVGCHGDKCLSGALS